MNDNYPDWYPAWKAEAFQELVKKNERLGTEFKIGHWEWQDYDLKGGTLKFSEQGVVKVVAEIQVVGTTKADDWQWAWSNEHLPEARTADAALVRDFGQENGIETLVKAHICDRDVEALGWELSAVMVRVTNALGVYRTFSRGVFLFFTLKSIAWAR